MTPRFGAGRSAEVVLVLALTLQTITIAPHWTSADPRGGVTPGDKADRCPLLDNDLNTAAQHCCHQVDKKLKYDKSIL